jgi:hypothetical protein
MDGQMVPVYKALRGDLTLLYLYRQSIGDGFYYLDALSGRYLPYVTLGIPAQAFTVLTPEEDVDVPEGWTPTSLTIDGKKLQVWRQDGQPTDIVLVYLMDERGEQSFFRYDTQSQLLFPYQAIVVPEASPTPAGTEPEPSVSQAPVPTESGSTGNPGTPNPWTLATAVMGLICLALIGLLIWQGARRGYDSGRSNGKHLPPPPPIKRI